MFNRDLRARPLNVASFASLPDATVAARQRLEAAGLDILQVTRFSINFAGTPDAFESAFQVDLVEKEVRVPNLSDTVTFIEAKQSTAQQVPGLLSTLATPFVDAIEGIALEVPRVLFAASPTAPQVDYWHLDVPDDVALHCNARLLQQLGVTGGGVRVAMVDSGWFRHPFFVAQGYNVASVVLGPGATDPDADESGHGTGESANILAIAPECQLLPVKMNFVNSIGAFNAAVELRPDIITCSWGSHTPFGLSAADMVLETSVAAAVASGITVIFSAGNGHCGFPGQHPDVISAGGAYVDENGAIQAADYASGFQSPIYLGRRVPDVCGLVGMRPKAIYIMLPVEPGDQIDTGNGVAAFPDGDETAADDGWAAFSGTSAAAPQLAGVAALIKQVVPPITPSGVKAALVATARDVEFGFCNAVPDVHGGLPALPGPDDATGAGLVDAFGAAVSAYVASCSGAFAGTSPQAAYWGSLAVYFEWAADAVATTSPESAEYYHTVAHGYASLAALY
jgi:subtilisin family serine protease